MGVILGSVSALCTLNRSSMWAQCRTEACPLWQEVDCDISCSALGRWWWSTWNANVNAMVHPGAASWRPAGRWRRSSGPWVPCWRSGSTLPPLSRLTTETRARWSMPTVTPTATATATATYHTGAGPTLTNLSTLRSHLTSARGSWDPIQRGRRGGSVTRPAPGWTTAKASAAAVAITSCSRPGVNDATASFTGAVTSYARSAG